MHRAVVTAANVHDKHVLPRLLHGREKRVYGDNAYASQKALIHSRGTQAKGFTTERVRRHKDELADEAKRAKSRNKLRMRVRVVHVFAVVKRLWDFGKVRYRGLAKDGCHAFTALAFIYLAPPPVFLPPSMGRNTKLFVA